jgi:hypothetical protein
MAAAAQALPDRGQPILPPHDFWIRRGRAKAGFDNPQSGLGTLTQRHARDLEG